MTAPDPLALAQALIRCPSVTPTEGGVLAVLDEALDGLGFVGHRLRFEAPNTPAVDNLYARLGEGGRNFCFAGHTDVVPVGEAAAWTVDPFAAVVKDGHLWGRGAADMKTAIACFVAAAARFIAARGRNFGGSISLLITNDEEGPAVNGTVKVLDWLKGRGEKLDACLVGEPTCPKTLGEMMKIGRRGSLNGRLTVHGVQGHAAYPENADNPIHRLMRMIEALLARPLDDGSAHFPPSGVQITTVDVGNPATNVIPAKAAAGFNIRFNDRHSGAALERQLRTLFDGIGGRYDLAIEVSGESFLTAPGDLTRIVAEAVTAETGIPPEASTSGGTSDARFITRLCPVVEFGMVGATSHQADERVPVADVERLTAIYRRMLDLYFPAR